MTHQLARAKAHSASSSYKVPLLPGWRNSWAPLKPQFLHHQVWTLWESAFGDSFTSKPVLWSLHLGKTRRPLWNRCQLGSTTARPGTTSEVTTSLARKAHASTQSHGHFALTEAKCGTKGRPYCCVSAPNARVGKTTPAQEGKHLSLNKQVARESQSEKDKPRRSPRGWLSEWVWPGGRGLDCKTSLWMSPSPTPTPTQGLLMTVSCPEPCKNKFIRTE